MVKGIRKDIDVPQDIHRDIGAQGIQDFVNSHDYLLRMSTCLHGCRYLNIPEMIDITFMKSIITIVIFMCILCMVIR